MADFAQLLQQSPNLLQQYLDDFITKERQRQQLLSDHASVSFSQLQDATRAPLPQPDPLESGVQQLFGDVASIASRRPEFQQRSREDILQKRALMLQQRGENLELLRARYMDAASKVGKLDPVKEMEYREKADKLSKIMEQQHETEIRNLQDTAAMDREKEASKTAIRVAEIRAQADRDAASMSLSAKFPKEAFEERWNKVFEHFTDTKTEGINKKNVPYVKMSLLNLARKDDTQPTYEGRLIEAFKRLEGKKKLSIQDAQLIRLWSSMKFAAPPSEEGEDGEPDYNAPAVEGVETTAPRSPVIQQLTTEANTLLRGLKSGGPLAAARQQQTMRRLEQIRQILKVRFGMQLMLPGEVPQVEGIEVER